MKQNPIIIALCLLNLLAILLFTSFYFLNSQRIVYVDSVRLLKNYKGMEAARKELNFRSETYKANLDTLRKEVEQAVNRFEQSKNASLREKQLMEELVKSRQQEYMNYEQVVGDQVKKQDQEMSVKLLEKVNDYLRRYGQKNGYSLILAATPYGNIAFGAEATDITDEVLVGLNKEYMK